ncbi:hypothetical protein EJ05DRAFT_310028 [Pseudovirgaria hyperparasitica]|uniref:Uncharacterized protein n=1 Tax=Pseudovirgaria hyperparasitica TaxID=470096 RepID=A0A6A6WAC0_9PEZI|nr:uncharacterized protein EJ05DRAFT_310028 [Pseudovirgaria hyperparasitica]KAF2759802.1 hypothetical protein EJ05DRAFT_310028 [Pseudovirgaria hyperparasitica]
MSWAVAIDAIGTISGALGIVDFLKSNFAGNSPPSLGASVQIKAGLQCPNNCHDFGGQIVSIQGYDANNAPIGRSTGGHIGDGGVIEVVLSQPEPGKQVDFLSVANGNDATCISWIAVRQFDKVDAAAGAWNGDIGQQCGQSWYAGNQIAGRYRDGGDWRPSCTWLDADASNGIVSAALKFGVQAYGEVGAASTLAQNRQCSATLYSRKAVDIGDKPATKRSLSSSNTTSTTSTLRPRRPWMDSHLVISTSAPTHNATEMCLSPTSWGPDFVGTDGYFCDMATRELTPLCATKQVPGCLEMDHPARTLRKRSLVYGGGRGAVARREVVSAHRVYGSVDVWS